MQIDECRVVCDDKTPFPVGATSGRTIELTTSKPRTDDDAKWGRWPPNCCHDGSDEVMEAFARFGESSSRASGYDWDESNQNNSVHVTKNIKSGVHFGDSGTIARFFYSAKADAEDRVASRHPTVKPLSLMEWLVKLVTPQGATVIDPFAGTGSTGIAAAKSGRNAVLIEREAEYIADIERRMNYNVVSYTKVEH